MAISHILENEQIIFSIDQSDINERITHLESIQHKAPRLHLEVISSVILPEGLILKIDIFGLENSIRDKRDGYVYFGSENDKCVVIVL
jgi:hypothetical protein